MILELGCSTRKKLMVVAVRVKKHFTAFDACVLAACLIVFSPGVSGLKIFTTSDKTVTVGGSFRLESIEGDRWFRGERIEIHPGGRYQIILSPPSSTLTVNNATMDDAGIYECCLMEGTDETCYKGRMVVHPKPPCEPFVTPAGMWADTNSTQLQVGCKHNGHQWNLTCIRGEWTGEYGPCPLERAPCESFEVPAGMWADTKSTQLQVGCKHNGDVWNLTCIRGEWTGEYGPFPLENTKYKIGFITVMIFLVLNIILIVDSTRRVRTAYAYLMNS